MISVKQAAEKWKVSERRVQKLCNDGRIKGAVKFGKISFLLIKILLYFYKVV